MKTLKLIAAFIILLVSTNTMQAQVSVNVNLGSPPSWGPAGFSAVDYYYLPDVQSYYDIKAKQFIYLGDGRWVRSRNLPNQYRNYDLYNGYKVVLDDYRGTKPYNNFNKHKVKYFKGYKGKPQKTIGSRRVVVRKAIYNRGNNENNNHSKGKGHNSHGKGNKGNGNDKH